MKLIFALFLLYCIYPIDTGKQRWQCALDASGVYTIIKVFSSQKLVTVTNIKICQELHLIRYGNPMLESCSRAQTDQPVF